MIMILAMIEYRSSGSCGDVTLMLKDTECLNHRPYSSWIFMWKRSRTRRMTLLADIESLTHPVDKGNDSIDVGHNVLWLSILILYQLIQNPAFQLLPWNSKVHYYSTTLMIQTAIRPANYCCGPQTITQHKAVVLPCPHSTSFTKSWAASYPESLAVLSSLHPAIKIGLSNLRPWVLEHNCTCTYADIYKQLSPN